MTLRLFSARPNLFVGHVPNSALYSKWYFEVAIDHVEQMSSMTPHFRVGWGNTKGLVFQISYIYQQDTTMFLLTSKSLISQNLDMFLIPEEVKNGEEMEWEMIYIHMVMMVHTCGQVVGQVW